MTRETIKEYILQVKSQDGTEALYNRWEPDILVEVINEIFNDHEAQLKAKESDLERQDMIIKCLNIDLDNKEKLLKAKDEEIKELGEIVQQYLIPSKNYDAITQAKDDEIRRLNNLYADTIKDLGDALIEIERLNADIECAKNMMKGLVDGVIITHKVAISKARSIVAMLFWMMKRQKAIYAKSFNDLGINNHNTSFYKGAYENSKMRFKQAYKMLKAQQ